MTGIKKISIVSFIYILTGLSVLGLHADTASKYRDINIYLKFSDDISNQISGFNKHLQEQGLLEKYSIVPFIKNHGVHLSLYLTTYDTDSLPLLKEALRKISLKMHKFKIKTLSIESSASNFVMLEVVNSKYSDGSNNLLQVYSDMVVDEFQNLRYKKSEIPGWADSFPAKKRAFELYGSPNVYMQFAPHFSILALDKLPSDEKEYLSDMQKAVETYKFSPVEADAEFVGIGYVDKNGQLTEEIALFPLSR